MQGLGRKGAILIITAIATATSGYLLLRDWARIALNSPALFEHNLNQEIWTLQKEFSHDDEYRIQFPELTSVALAPELKDPSAILPHTHLYDPKELKALSTYAQTCVTTQYRASAKLTKAWQFHRAVCDSRYVLPSSFWTTAPFMHPNGSSFASLFKALKKSAPENTRHVFERVRERFPSLGLTSYRQLLSLEKLVFSGNTAFVRISGSEIRGHDYLALDADMVRHRLEQTGLRIIMPKVTNDKIYIMGDIALEANTLSKITRNVLKGIFVASLLAMIFICLWLLIFARRQGRAFSDHKKILLQTLAHEIRTPATSLKLAIERMRPDFDQMPEKTQAAYLDLCDGVQRLTRVVEGSSAYLKTTQKNLDFRTETHSSWNDLVKNIVHNQLPEAVFVPSDNDGPVSIDRFWLELCLRNLLENAQKYGRAPYLVRARLSHTGAEFDVEDQGNWDGKNNSRPQAGGLGLGLTIIQQVAVAMGGKFRLQTHPTRFRVTFPNPGKQ